MKPLVIDYMDWEQLVRDLTGQPYSPHVDDFYTLRPIEKTLPKRFLKRVPYEANANDCDDRASRGKTEIRDRTARRCRRGSSVPVTLVIGQVTGEGRHAFLIVGGLDPQGEPVARYCHRLEKHFEWISTHRVTNVEDLW